MNERDQITEKPMSDAEKNGLAKKKAINKAASYFSDDDSLFEFEGFEIEELAKDIDEFNRKEAADGAIKSADTLSGASATESAEKRDGKPLSESTEKKSEGLPAESAEESLESVSNENLENTTVEIAEENLESTSVESVEENLESTSVEIVEEILENTTAESSEEKTKVFLTEPGFLEAPVENGEIINETDGAGFKGALESEFAKQSESDGGSANPAASPYDGSEAYDGLEAEYTSERDKAAISELKAGETYNSSVSDSLFDRLKNNVVFSPAAAPQNDAYKTPKSGHTSEYDDVLESGLEHRSVNAEGQIRFEGTEDDFLTEDENTSEGSLNTESYTENETLHNEDYIDDLRDEEDLDNEIWDRAGKEEWQARESFLSYCKSLTLPAPSAVTYKNKEDEPVKVKATSSGYRYAESERIPVFADGMYGGVDKSGYAERERHYCENRKITRDIALREKTRSLHRAVLYTALILFTVFLLELLNFFISGQVVLFASIEIGLTVLCAAFVWKGLTDGLKCAVRGVFIPELLTFLTVLLSLAYGSATVFSASASQSAVLIGLPGVGAMFLTAVYRSLMSKREKKVFDITADYGSYCTEARLSSFKGSPEEIAFGGYAGENSSLYRTNRIARSDGGYNLQPVRDECFGLIKILLICVICAAIASGIAFGFIQRDVSYGIFSAYILVCLSCPLSVFLSLSLPRYTTALDVAEDGAAITDFDDESDELDENVIMLSEEELFPPQKTRIIDTYWTNSHFLENHLSKAAAAFRKAGGLLSDLFSSIDLNPGNYRDIVITDISEDGITVKVDDSLVRAGSDAYLEKHGIEIERYPDIPQKDTRVLYIANNGEFFSRIAIQFCPDERLCRKMAELRQSDTLFSLKTCNPCIDSALVFYTTGLEPELLRTVKYMIDDTVCDTDTDREGILVSRTGARGLLSALLGYKRQKRLVLLGARLAAMSGLVGLTLSLSVSLIGARWGFISFIILGFHAVMSGAAAFIGMSGQKKR